MQKYFLSLMSIGALILLIFLGKTYYTEKALDAHIASLTFLNTQADMQRNLSLLQAFLVSLILRMQRYTLKALRALREIEKLRVYITRVILKRDVYLVQNL
jgi:hypothetical protein